VVGSLYLFEGGSISKPRRNRGHLEVIHCAVP
jgi:hypothetical protein